MISATKLVFLNLTKHTPNNINTPKRATFSNFLRNIMSATDQTMGFEQPRLVAKKVLAKPQSEGEGAVVRRSIGRYPNFLFSSPDWALFLFSEKMKNSLQITVSIFFLMFMALKFGFVLDFGNQSICYLNLKHHLEFDLNLFSLIY